MKVKNLQKLLVALFLKVSVGKKEDLEDISNEGKRQRMVYDGNNQDDPEFTKEVTSSLGAFSTTNQWSVDILDE
jgi:IS4 transposase